MVDLATLQGSICLTFNNTSLLEQALIHRSYLNENPDNLLPSNERLEFLGDALIGFAVAHELYRRYSQLQEGELSKLRAAVVCQECLAQMAKELHLGQYLYMGKGEEQGGGRQRDRNLACVFEAVVGAVLLDLGYDAARDFVLKMLAGPIEQSVQELGARDYKSGLQVVVQSRMQVTPSYRVVKTSGPDHDRVFVVDVLADGVVIGSGTGKSKQQAEKEAARVALEKLGAEDETV
ncbi:MAG: ribonuclease III [Chloroflexi bacterium]|jgi:ribonuclease III|nr:ribonuclease III [Chloroflexota bacterium]MBT7081662.1 ribonuclease III [Chloroflexota bacterium]